MAEERTSRRHLPRTEPVRLPIVDRPGVRAEIPSDAVHAAARDLGFSRVGICEASEFEDAGARLKEWSDRGYAGDMDYLLESERHRPEQLLAGVRSIIVVGLACDPPRQPEPTAPSHGRIAAYALGKDYHGLIRSKLEELAERLQTLVGRELRYRAVVDTAPLLEREAARRAGVGFVGKNTLSIAPGVGSHLLLGELLVDMVLARDQPVSQGCGSCTRCLDACPTGAFVGPYVLDARRCISYLTIEHRGSIPRQLRPLMGQWVFGCDECQSVCPYNASKKRMSRSDALGVADGARPSLVTLLRQSARAHRRMVRGTALSRVSRARMARNAAVALGNGGDVSAVPALVDALRSDPNPLVRAHSAWALGRLRTQEALTALKIASETDDDANVRSEAAKELPE